MSPTTHRFALVESGSTGANNEDLMVFSGAVSNYLPANYVVVDEWLTIEGEMEVLIGGADNCGWTLEDYVLPRLASGLYWGHEVTFRDSRSLRDRSVRS